MIEEKVFQCIREFGGGQKFFDELDDLIRNDVSLVNALLEKAIFRPRWFNESDIWDSNPLVILSGKFGQVYEKIIRDASFDVLVLEGALRFNEIHDPRKYFNTIRGRYCVFLDDSYFAGRTSNKVKDLIDDCLGVYCGTFVAYDGSRLLNHEVFSLFRYYDHFGREKEEC